MALARMYCGVAAAETPSWLTVAVVDDAGRLLDLRHLSDDATGYAHLGALLGERMNGSPVAADRPDYLVTQLLAAANRPLAIAEAPEAADFAERFCDENSYEEMQAPPHQRRAVGLARALQAGALYVTAHSASAEFEELKPLLAAHAAVTAGREAAAMALREVLRELFPAALRAFPDPAEYLPLRILEALPDPSLFGPANQNREAALIAQLASSGVADHATAANAVAALRVAVSESPRWHTTQAFAPAVAETVRQAVAAVQACDTASAALVASLSERLAALAAEGGPSRPYLVPAAPVSPAPRRAASGAEVPPGPPQPHVVNAAPVGPRPYIPPPRPAPGPAPGSRSNWPLVPVPDDDRAVGYTGPSPATPAAAPAASSAATAFRADPLNAPLQSPPRSSTPSDRPSDVDPSRAWHTSNVPAEPQLKLVDQPAADPLTDPLTRSATSPPVLRVIDGQGASTAEGLGTDGQDDDLLIFSQTRSAWFTSSDDVSLTDDTVSWGRLTDEGWRAAEQVARPAVGAETAAGLPRRVPLANLVPGSPPGPQRRLRIVRDPRAIADHTAGYFRGWRRGQEIGGFAVGQRDRAAWEFNRDQRARQSAQQRARSSS